MARIYSDPDRRCTNPAAIFAFDRFTTVVIDKESAVERNKLSEEIQNCINWANDKVDWYDPLVKKEDSLLDNIDKNKLF